jgi:hypothetical protein
MCSLVSGSGDIYMPSTVFLPEKGVKPDDAILLELVCIYLAL